MDGTATAPNDYASLTITLPIAAGGTSATINLGTVDDDISEISETFTATLSNPTNGLALGDPVVTVVTIDDNDAGKI